MNVLPALLSQALKKEGKKKKKRGKAHFLNHFISNTLCITLIPKWERNIIKKKQDQYPYKYVCANSKKIPVNLTAYKNNDAPL